VTAEVAASWKSYGARNGCLVEEKAKVWCKKWLLRKGCKSVMVEVAAC